MSLPEELVLFGGAAVKSAALEIGRRASGRPRRRLGRLAEVAKEPGDALGIPDERDDLGASTAVLAGVEVDGERAPEQLDEGAVLRAMGCGDGFGLAAGRSVPSAYPMIELALPLLVGERAKPAGRRRRLVRVLDRYRPQIPGYFLYYPSRLNLAPKLKVLVDSLRMNETPRRSAR